MISPFLNWTTTHATLAYPTHSPILMTMTDKAIQILLHSRDSHPSGCEVDVVPSGGRVVLGPCAIMDTVCIVPALFFARSRIWHTKCGRRVSEDCPNIKPPYLAYIEVSRSNH